MSNIDGARVELHAHSAFSFLDGASLPDELAAAAAEQGYTHVALTDHDSLAGALEFAHAAKVFGIHAITGAELTVRDDAGRSAHVTVLVASRTGYSNLTRLITRAYAPRVVSPVRNASEIAATWIDVEPGDVPRQPPLVLGSAERPLPEVTVDDLCEHAEGLILLTGCARHGLLALDLENDRPSHALATLQRLQQHFGADNVFVELQVTQQRGDAQRNRLLCSIAEQAHARVVATGNVHAHDAQRARLHDLLVAIRNNTTVEACEAQRPGNLSRALVSPDMRARRFAQWPGAIENAGVIAERISFDLTQDLGYQYPRTSGDADLELARACDVLFEQRYAGRSTRHAARQRLEEELAIARRHNLSGFFLLHRDVLDLAREVASDVRGASSARALNPPGRGRGSSVESVICYLTGLSHVDPLEAGLSLGRFLNEELPSVPDIDLDFPRDIRHELLRRLVEKYGNDRCAMVAAHATYRRRGAIRDVGRALSLPQAELARIAAAADGGIESIVDVATGTGARWDAFRTMTQQIAGLPRQIGQHSGGVVIASDPLDALVPIQPAAMAGRQIVQWDKDSCSDAGFLKIDVLGLGMLSAVEACVEDIASQKDPGIDLSRIAYDDAAVFESIGRGDTVGVFQIESRAQIQSLQRVQPQNMHDLAIQVALIRPGPIIGQSVNPYIQFRERLREDPNAEPEFDHPVLREVLAETHGAIIWQDQVLQVAMGVAGFSAGEADALRRAMTRKKASQAITAHRERFLAGATAKGIEEAAAETIFSRLLGFSHYGFPKAHSVAFALLAYQSTWLREYYPAQFFCALLNAQPMGFYPPDTLLRDAARRDVAAAAPDINASGVQCHVEQRADGSECIRVGLSYVSGVGTRDARQVVDARDMRGPFTDIADAARRIHLPLHQLERLVGAGVTDSLPGERREHLWQVGVVSRERALGLGDEQPLELAPTSTPSFAQLSLIDEVAADFETTGLSVRAHPVELLRGLLPPDTASSRDVREAQDRSNVTMVGSVVARQRPSTAKGVTFMLLEDEHGMVNVVVPPPLYASRKLVIRSAALVVVDGRVERHGDVVNLVATDVRRLPKKLVQSLPQQQPRVHFR